MFTCRYLSCRADEDSAITMDASFNAFEAFCSPSAAMTWTNLKKIVRKSFLGCVSSFSYLCPGLPGCLSLSGHRALELDWEAGVFAERSVRLDYSIELRYKWKKFHKLPNGENCRRIFIVNACRVLVCILYSLPKKQCTKFSNEKSSVFFPVNLLENLHASTYDLCNYIYKF